MMKAVLFLTMVASLMTLGAAKPFSYRLDVEATAYCPLGCCGNGDQRTAWPRGKGRDANLAGVAVESSVIPLGSHLDIPGYTRGPNGNGSWIIADDVGGAIKKKKGGLDRIDVRMTDHAAALQWGRKFIRVRVWPKGK